jgi:hypothetical protein
VVSIAEKRNAFRTFVEKLERRRAFEIFIDVHGRKY